MRQKPNLPDDGLIACLRARYDLDVASVRFLPIGYDRNAFVYRATTTDDASYFVKIRIGAVPAPSLLVPRILLEHGIPNILAPLRTKTQALWCPLDAYSVIVYPFIDGENAMVAGLSDTQWREFGATLGAIHSGGFANRLQGQIPAETFALPSAHLVRHVTAQIPDVAPGSPTATQLATFWTENASRLEQVLVLAETIGKELQSRQFEHVLCHADIHAANILVGEDGGIYLVDWDGPLLAPRERDLLFVVGSKIARVVESHEEALFFEGYGDVDVDTTALAYYRYERAIEDIGEIGRSVLFDTDQNEAAKSEEADLLYRIMKSALDDDHHSGRSASIT